MPMDRPWFDAWVDDDGSGTLGTIWNKGEIKKLVDGVDSSMHVGQLYAPVAIAVVASWGVPNLYGNELATGVTIYAPGQFRIASGGGGLYCVQVSLQWVPNGPGTIRGMMVQVGSRVLCQQFVKNFADVGGPSISTGVYALFNATDIVTLQCYTDVATSLATDSRFGIARI